MGDIDVATREFNAAIVDYVASVGPLHPYEALYAAYFATCLLDAGRIGVDALGHGSDMVVSIRRERT